MDLAAEAESTASRHIADCELEFNGRVRWVELDLGDEAEDADHLIGPEERLRIAMARQ